MIKTVAFLKDYRCFKPLDAFSFRPGVNLLVGEQGCGKSTILAHIYGRPPVFFDNKDKGVSVVLSSGGYVAYFDFEKDNLRTLTYFKEGMIDTQLQMMWSSHGQSVNAVLSGIKRLKDALVLFDEPDMALSIRSCHKLAKLLKEAAENGCQVIASVHNPIVIAAFPEVLSVEHRRWMPSAEFIAAHSSDA